MKLLRLFGVMVAVLMASLTTVSCSDDDDNAPVPTSSIVGTWTQTNTAGTFIAVTFKADKSGTIKYTYSNGDDSTERFEYDYLSADRELTILGGQLGGVYDVTVTASKLLLVSWDGSAAYQFEKKK